MKDRLTNKRTESSQANIFYLASRTFPPLFFKSTVAVAVVVAVVVMDAGASGT